MCAPLSLRVCHASFSVLLFAITLRSLCAVDDAAYPFSEADARPIDEQGIAISQMMGSLFSLTDEVKKVSSTHSNTPAEHHNTSRCIERSNYVCYYRMHVCCEAAVS